MATTLSINGLSSPSNLLCYDRIPNIVKVSDATGGSYTQVTLTFSNNLSTTVSGTGQYNISLEGNSVVNSTETDCNGRYFYIPSSTTSLAANVVRALRNCPNVASKWNIYRSSSSVIFVSKQYGAYALDDFTTNISTSYWSLSTSYGSVNSSIDNAKISMDIFSGTSLTYVTTLEKTANGSECVFDITPMLKTISSDSILPFRVVVEKSKDGLSNSIGTINAYVGHGYKSNSTDNYMFLSTSQLHWADITTGTRWFYERPTISFHVLSIGTTKSFTITYYNSAGISLGSESQSFATTGYTNTVQLNLTNLTTYSTTSYITVATSGEDTLRFYRIKPILTVDDYQRIYWQNSLGGTSFIDLVGEDTIDTNIDRETYQHSLFNYYNPDYSHTKIRKLDETTTYTWESHLMNEESKYAFQNLALTDKAWIIDGGVEKEILIDGVSFQETETDGAWKATVSYHFSLTNTF